jgi:hypothetical protein
VKNYSASICPEGPQILDYAPRRMGEAIIAGGVHLKPPPRVSGVDVNLGDFALETLAVQRVLERDEFDFYTPAWIAGETGLRESVVVDVLAQRRLARRPWGQPRLSLYARADRRVTVRELVSWVHAMLAKRV